MSVVRTKRSTCKHEAGKREEKHIASVNAVYTHDALEASRKGSTSVTAWK